ncbi:unnamed protein product [Bursaphelenchus xylophilus]|uniref:(pine wood nematode) hypothetical protein n=1 Tax=Bursaphelenchus xylophilus TaxID=6326 RepID=A0A1I7RR88_BURXY|nr:unnamed protein product [Bursaphelenchus xylophilus]CAG9130875.1 unnamed protein product [Bursaphelenchus xylophilus]
MCAIGAVIAPVGPTVVPTSRVYKKQRKRTLFVVLKMGPNDAAKSQILGEPDLCRFKDSMNSSSSGAILHSTETPIIIPSIKQLPLDVKLTVVAYCYILPVICVVGIIGNAMNVVTLASRKLRAVSYMYLRALAIADLLCMLFVLSFVSCEVLVYNGYSLNGSYWYGFYQSHIILSFINWALATGVFIVVALSLERYVSIVFPMHFRQWNSPSRARRAICAAYMIPAMFYLPYAVGRYSVETKTMSDGTVVYMQSDSDISKTLYWQIYKWSREAFLRFLPIIVLTILNAQIMMAFRKRQQMFARLKNRDQNSQVRDDTLLYILGGIVAMFFVCNIPAAINLLFINETVKKRVDYQIFRAIANLLEITNHAAQFYIFCVCSTDYRATFLLKFPCFKAYYTNREKLRSFIRRPQAKNDNGKSAPPPSMAMGISSIKRSSTLEGTTCQHKEPETVDIHLASGEDDISDEADSLLNDENKNKESTYL